MRICITATGKDLDAEVDPRFGRCQYFVIVDPDSMKFEALSNASISASGGAGIKAAQTIVNEGAEVVITGNVGPNAFQTLSAAGIKIITGASGTLREAIDAYKRGGFDETRGATVAEHSGMGGIGSGGGGHGRGRGGR
ncbi:MAG: NifB/NifX family molybdenum-iron cluster-binding protein [Halobacteriota archaeon]|nr:NifB/NifX family molybdenum-iron cluster-binding protein [Halobacteriota archaeon]